MLQLKDVALLVLFKNLWLNKTATPPASIVVTDGYYDRMIQFNSIYFVPEIHIL
jgi:hypothetical protein